MQAILRLEGERDGKGMIGRMEQVRELMDDGVEQRRDGVGDNEGRSVTVAMPMAHTVERV